jgi:hypothetical protein
VADFPLAVGGRAAPLLVDPTEAEQPELRQALRDLRAFVYEATGTRPQLLTSGSPTSGPVVLVGRTARAAGIEPSEEEVGFDGYLIDVTADRLSLAGPNPAATANAIYDFCESTIGVRFHAPGPDGTFVPELTALRVPIGRRLERPAFAHRQAWYNGNVLAGASSELQEELQLFALRNRAGGIGAVIRHYFSDLVPPSTHFDEDPEYFAEVHGQRVADGQLCTSHPYVRHLTVEHWIERFTREPGLRVGSLSPNDGERFCSCETCRHESPDLITRLVMFMNDVTRRITSEHPDRYLSFYAYASLVEPPYEQGMRLHRRLIPTVARYSVCQVHPISDGECRSIVNFRRQLEGWAAISDQIMVREYAAWWPVPDLTFAVMADNIRTYRSLGAIGISREYLRRGFMSDILMAIDLHLQWDPDSDPDELLRGLLRARFGTAAGERHRALDGLRQVLDELPATAAVTGDERSGTELYRPAVLLSAIERLDRLATTQSGRVRRRVAEEVDLLRMALAEVEAKKAINRYKWSGRGADRQTAVDQLAAASDLARRLEPRDRIGANTLAILEGKTTELASAGLTEPISEAFDYRDDMARGGFSRRDADHVDGYYPGVYGLALLPRKIGRVSYTITAAPGKRFVRAELYDLVFRGSDTRITVRANGIVYPIAEGIALDDRDLVLDLTPILAGAERFTVIFWAQNNTSNPILCLDNWGIRGEVE